MNDQLENEYIDCNQFKVDTIVIKEDDKFENNKLNIEEFEKKCNLNTDYEQIEGDDEHETDEEHNTSNSTQRRRRKSSGRSKLNKILQSSSLSSSSNMSTNSKLNNNTDQSTNTEDAPQSSSSTSLSSWIHLSTQPEQNFNPLTKNKSKNLNSSYDTISEEEHRARIKKRNLRSIDDDIVSSNEDLPIDVTMSKEKQDKKVKQQSCDSLSSSPTNVSYDSSSPVKSSSVTASRLIRNTTNQQQNKENHQYDNKLINHQNLLMNNKSATSNLTTSYLTIKTGPNQLNNHQCLNCQNNCLTNNNYITIQQPTIPWLYDSITREDADKYLQKFLNIGGVFLVRTSSKNPDNYVLSFVHDRRVKHAHIRKMEVDSTICFTIDDGKMKFYDLKQLVEFYQLNLYFLPTKLKYFLIHNSK